jgi:CCR4-NOT transcription complex subunit 4
MESYRNVRVLQKNLLYVVGLPASACRDGPQGKREFFGKYGPIVKIAITPKKVSNSTYCAYVTYKRSKDAEVAMKALNKISVDGRLVRAAYGTTKYCSYFLRGRQCLKTGCLYLHELAKSEDCYTKDDLSEMERLHALQQPTPALPQPPSMQRAVSAPAVQTEVAWLVNRLAARG